VIVQVAEANQAELTRRIAETGAQVIVLGNVTTEGIMLRAGKLRLQQPTRELLRSWTKTSYHLDRLQTKAGKAEERFQNFLKHPLKFTFPSGFSGVPQDYGIDLSRSASTGLTAVVIREQGTNGEREMAFALHAAGFDVRDVTMSDLISEKETLADARFVVFPGGFANSDVLGAGRGWAGVFKFNQAALSALQRFMQRPDTLSLGVCNGCQLMVNLDLIYPEHQQKMAMLHNDSGKFESAFLNVEVGETKSMLLKPLVGSQLGVWVAHGEGKFYLPEAETAYDVPLRYVSPSYPFNPNGSALNAAAIVSRDGRHLAIMPHLERSSLPRHWAYYPEADRRRHLISPWMLAFAAARDWLNAWHRS
jgi:phosphoribosylformylglycinamidine synthase